MALIVPVPSGGTIALENFDVSRVYEGFELATIPAGVVYRLISSDEAVDHDNYEAVKDNASLRWAKQSSGGDSGTTTPTPDAVPKSFGTGKLAPGWLPPGLNGATFFASPDGDDDADGTTWQTAVEHGYVAYEKMQAAGGGTLTLANLTHWGGPVSGQGIWLREDAQAIDGWQAAVPCIIQGMGAGSTVQFQDLGTAIIYAGSNHTAFYRRKPAVWTAHLRHQVEFRNIETRPPLGHEDNQIGNYRAFRIGWDYPRNEDGTPMTQACITSERTGTTGNGSTVHTIALAPAITITTAERTSNVITFTIPRPGDVAAPPWRIGTKVWFASNDAAFTSGSYTVVDSSASIDNDASWNFTVASAGTNSGAISSPGTIRSLVFQTGDLLDLESTNAQFLSTSYLVTDCDIVDATTGTITCRDNYGGWSGFTDNAGPSSDIGVVIQQERGYNGGTNTRLINCTSIVNQGTGAQTTIVAARTGPQFDFGGGVAFPYEIERCLLVGFYPPIGSGIPFDEYRHSACMQAINQVAGCGAGMYAKNMKGIQGSFRIRLGENSTGAFSLDTAVFEATNPEGDAPPGYIITGGPSSTAFIKDVQFADVSPGYGFDLNSIVGLTPDNISGNSAYGPYTLAIGGSVAPSSNVVFTDFTSPWVGLKVGTWGKDLKITGRHPAAWRQISPVSVRYKNIADPPASWTMIHGTKTTGIEDPLGATGACRLTDTGAATEAKAFSGTDSVNTFAAGGRYVIAGWINQETLASYNASLVFGFVGTGDVIWQSTGTGLFVGQSPFKGTGWQFVVIHDIVVSASASQNYDIRLIGPTAGSSASTTFFGVTAFYVPDSVDDNDFYEMIGTLKAYPYYLQPGYAGTFEDQKFIAHGGIGGPSRDDIVLDGSPNGIVVPYYDKDTGALLGYFPLSDEA